MDKNSRRFQETFGTSCWTRRRTRPTTRSRRLTKERGSLGTASCTVGSLMFQGWVSRSKPGCSRIPGPPKREEELADHVEMWQDKMRRMEAHGDEFKLAPLCKINALRMPMTGKAKEYFDFWQVDHDPTNAAKTYEELLSKVKDYARRRKLDSSAKEKFQEGGDPMDVGVVGGWDCENYDYDQYGVYASVSTRKGTGN
jgi:hypothetical protein